MQKGSVLGDTFEKLTELAKDSGKAVTVEPVKILQQALGMEGDDNTDPLEQGASANPHQNQQQNQPAADMLMAKKRQEDGERVQKLLALHRQRLKEEEAYFEESEAREEQQEKLGIQEEQRKEQEEIIQLQRQEAKDAVLNAPTAAGGNGPRAPGAVQQAKKLTGTKEIGKSKAD